MKNQKKSGISLIVLVITIIVIVILAVAVILSIANNNPIENANKAKFQNDVKSMQEELELIKAKNYAENQGNGYKNKDDNSEIGIYQLTSSTKYDTKFAVKNGQLVYNSSELTKEEKEWAEELGISSSAYVINSSGDGLTLSDNTISGRYTGDESDIEISGVETISDSEIGSSSEGVFTNSNIVSVSIEDVKTIGLAAFSHCEKLEKVILGDTVEEIGYYAFSNCKNLKDLKLSNHLKTIKGSAFSGCTSLEEISIPESVETIEDGAFAICNKLAKISIYGNPIISNDGPGYAFYECANDVEVILGKNCNIEDSVVKRWFESSKNVTITRL